MILAENVCAGTAEAWASAALGLGFLAFMAFFSWLVLR